MNVDYLRFGHEPAEMRTTGATDQVSCRCLQANEKPLLIQAFLKGRENASSFAHALATRNEWEAKIISWVMQCTLLYSTAYWTVLLCEGAGEGPALWQASVSQQWLEHHGWFTGHHFTHWYRHLYVGRSQSKDLRNSSGLPSASNPSTSQVTPFESIHLWVALPKNL